MMSRQPAAQAVLDLYPGAKFAIGPPITDGFYYDFEVEDPFTPEDLERIDQILEAEPDVIRHRRPRSLYFGPNEVLVNIEANFADHLSADDIELTVDRIESAEATGRMVEVEATSPPELLSCTLRVMVSPLLT